MRYSFFLRILYRAIMHYTESIVEETCTCRFWGWKELFIFYWSQTRIYVS